MKQLIFTCCVLLLSVATAQAATISVGNIDNINVANLFLGSSSSADCSADKNSTNCDFVDYSGALLTDPELATSVTSDPASYVTRSQAENGASFDIGFDGFDIYNGAGNDLVIFTVGNDFNFALDVFDKSGTIIDSGIFDVTVADTVFDNDGNWLCVGGSDDQCTNGYPLSAIFIDLGDSIAGDVALGKISVSLNNSAFSLAGGFHTEATVVPLPLPALLFISGLTLLGWVGRRKPH